MECASVVLDDCLAMLTQTPACKGLVIGTGYRAGYGAETSPRRKIEVAPHIKRDR